MPTFWTQLTPSSINFQIHLGTADYSLIMSYFYYLFLLKYFLYICSYMLHFLFKKLVSLQHYECCNVVFHTW